MSTIPIVITPLPVPVGAQALNINQLIALISKHLSASIDVDNVSFFLQGFVAPSSDQGLFFNKFSNQFQIWSSSQGKYIPVSTDLQVGDAKLSFVSGDDVNAGWLVCNGRSVNSITGISNNQKQILITLFGASGNLPSLTDSAPDGGYYKVFVGYP